MGFIYLLKANHSIESRYLALFAVRAPLIPVGCILFGQFFSCFSYKKQAKTHSYWGAGTIRERVLMARGRYFAAFLSTCIVKSINY